MEASAPSVPGVVKPFRAPRPAHDRPSPRPGSPSAAGSPGDSHLPNYPPLQQMFGMLIPSKF